MNNKKLGLFKCGIVPSESHLCKMTKMSTYVLKGEQGIKNYSDIYLSLDAIHRIDLKAG